MWSANLLLDDLKSPMLEPSKNKNTEFILIGLREQLKKILDPSISLNLDSASTHTFTQNSPGRNLGVILDQNLSFFDHIAHLSRSSWRSCIFATFEPRRIRSNTAPPFCHLVTKVCLSLEPDRISV